MSRTADVHRLTSGPLAKQILRFSLPLIFSNVLQVLFNMSDVAVVGRFAGASALGSVGSCSILVSLFTGFLIGMGSGVNVLAARYYGAENHPALRQTVHTSVLVCTAMGFLILLLGLLFSRPLLVLLHTRDDLMEGAARYLRIYFLGMPAMALYNYGNGIFSAVGDTKRPLAYLLIAGVLNVTLNLFFVIVCRLDVTGVALASVISQYISAALIMAALLRTDEEYGLKPAEIRFSRPYAVSVLQLGIPAGVQSAIFSIANLFIQSGVNSFSSAMVEGNAAANNGDLLIFNVLNAFYIACSSFISQNFGAGKKDRVLKSYFLCMAYALAASLVLGGLYIVFGRQFLALFTTEPEVIECGMQRIRIMAMAFSLSVLMDGTTAASRGLGRTLLPVAFTILGSCVFRIIWIYTVFAHFGTVRSLFLVYVFSWIITAAAQVPYFIHCYKTQMKIIS